jgi:hypothetical protein
MSIADPILGSLSDDLLRWVEEQLSTNETSSDEELHVQLVAAGLTEAEATQALLYRIQYYEIAYPHGRSPIRTGDRAVKFNVRNRQFEIQ